MADIARRAHRLGPADLRQRRAGLGDREEKLGVGRPAGGTRPPLGLVRDDLVRGGGHGLPPGRIAETDGAAVTARFDCPRRGGVLAPGRS